MRSVLFIPTSGDREFILALKCGFHSLGLARAGTIGTHSHDQGPVSGAGEPMLLLDLRVLTVRLSILGCQAGDSSKLLVNARKRGFDE